MTSSTSHPDPSQPAAGPASGAADLVFPEGMVGLPALTRHKLSPVPETDLFELMSLDEPAMGFIAARADDVRPGMSGLLRERDVTSDAETVLVLLAVHGDPPVVTANLAGPLALDVERGVGRQLVLEDPAFPLRAPIAEP